MSELRPFPFDRLITRMFRELSERGSIFDLPSKKFVLGDASRDFSVSFHGTPASSALGPAAGPQSQMAQNIVLAWLGGSRIIELKTVQILDELEIPRPCIDVRDVGYNVEWSQELRLEQSLEEYVKGSMLVEMLRASGRIELAPGFDQVVYDMSVGYDLEGIKSDRVRAFIEGMRDASSVVERLRAHIPDEFAEFRGLEYRTNLSDSLTLSTFHGCPPEEIERIIDFLLREYGLNCVIKLNPTLLGPERVRELMNGVLGYGHAVTPDEAFEKDTKWDQMVGFVERLGATASGLGLGLGVKFNNTLIVENHRDFFPATEKVMYLSGQPLHVLAMSLVRDFRRVFGDRIPVSFSAGIDKHNFADAVALGLTPVTVCTDLLRQGGYARQHGYFQSLSRRMEVAGASNVDGFILRAFGHARDALERAGGVWTLEIEASLGDGAEPIAHVGNDFYKRWVRAAALLNTESYVESLLADARYAEPSNNKAPKKIGSTLELFNCITCDKCVPVCPNDANFTLDVPPRVVPIVKLARSLDGAWSATEAGTVELNQKHQIANFADFCNECGNCDIFCPEDGGPYVMKPRFFGTRESWAESEQDGFWLERADGVETIEGRFGGSVFALRVEGGRAAYSGAGFSVAFDPADPVGTVDGEATCEIDLTYYVMLELIRDGIYGQGAGVNYVNA